MLSVLKASIAGAGKARTSPTDSEVRDSYAFAARSAGEEERKRRKEDERGA
jgi:hypothetical protein